MTTYGLMFKPEMIRAYLAGVKTQTRRLKGLDQINAEPHLWDFIGIAKDMKGRPVVNFANNQTFGVFKSVHFPYGYTSDTLYFKECYRMCEDNDSGQDLIWYRADNAWVSPTWWTPEDWDKVHSGWFAKWQSSMFMPQRFSRFRDVPIVNVRVEQLQSITKEDAFAEGVRTDYLHQKPDWIDRDHYQELWDKINGKTLPWSKNPWLFVYEFPKYQKEQS